MDGMNERIIRLEERTDLFGKQLDRIVTRLDAMDEKLAGLAKLPSKEFLIVSLTAVLAIALAIAALTFTIADYAAKKAAPAATVPAPAASQQPLVIVVPSLSSVPTLPQPAPVAPPAPTP